MKIQTDLYLSSFTQFYRTPYKKIIQKYRVVHYKYIPCIFIAYNLRIK